MLRRASIVSMTFDIQNDRGSFFARRAKNEPQKTEKRKCDQQHVIAQAPGRPDGWGDRTP
jgi:hypothetical protein